MAVTINGDGVVDVGGNASSAAYVRLYEDSDNGTNYVDLIAPASVASNRTITLPDATTTVVGTDTTQTLTNKSIVATQLTGTIAAARLPAGSVLQVVQTVKTDVFSVNGNDSSMVFSDITGLSVSITPSSASNKILVFGDVLTGAAINGECAIRLIRGSTSIYQGDADGNRTRAVGAGFFDCNDTEIFSRQTFIYLDSPATTSSTTYKIQLGAFNNVTNYVNRGGIDVNGTEITRGASSITVMEIAG